MQEARSGNCPSIMENVVVGVVALIMIEQYSRLPEANVFVFLLCGVAILGVGLTYLVRVVRCSKEEPQDGVSPKRRILLSWIIFPVLVVLVLSSTATHWPATIRFYLSKSAFEDVIAEVHEGNRPEDFPRRVGLYWVEYVHYDFNYTTQQPIIGFVTGVALIDECGIYYDPKNPASSHWLTTRIAPCWYLTEW